MGRELLRDMDVLGMRRETVVVERNHLRWSQFRGFGVLSHFGLLAERASSFLRARESIVQSLVARERGWRKRERQHNGTYGSERLGQNRPLRAQKKGQWNSSIETARQVGTRV